VRLGFAWVCFVCVCVCCVCVCVCVCMCIVASAFIYVHVFVCACTNECFTRGCLAGIGSCMLDIYKYVK